MEPRRKKIMFLCTGNSARSQMAEGLAKQLGRDRIEAFSAGVQPKGVHPLAVKALDKLHIDIRSQTSKEIDPKLLQQMDILITVCANAESKCPVTPPHIQREHWPLEDPVQAKGTEAEQLETFCKTRDELKNRISALLLNIREFSGKGQQKSVEIL